MNYGQIKNQVLKLLNQYSVAGKTVATSYNNQQDYLNRIPGLVNDAIMEIATTSRKIPAVFSLNTTQGEEIGDRIRYELPGDFFQFQTGGTFLRTQDGRLLHTNLYNLQGRKYVLIPKEEMDAGSEYLVTYYRYPRLLGEKPAETDEPDNEPETHFAIPFYVAAFLVIHDDNFLYASFYNKFEDKLAKMGSGVSAEFVRANDAFAFGTGDIYDV